MLIVDRVVCDLCHEVVGQLFNQPMDQPAVSAPSAAVQPALKQA